MMKNIGDFTETQTFGFVKVVDILWSKTRPEKYCYEVSDNDPNPVFEAFYLASPEEVES